MDAAEWDRRYAEQPWLWTAQPNVFLVEEVAALAPGRALDLACGEGRNAVWLAERGWDVTGVDFSTVALDRARRLADDRGVAVALVHADLDAYEPPRRAFDLVVALYLQVPPVLRRVALGRAVEAVAEGGTLLVVGHDLENLEHGVGGPHSPDVLYTVDDVVAAVAPLAVIKAGQVLRAVESDGEIRQAIDTLVRAVRPG
jgi:SAM-dependent methyltransferase